MAEIKVMLIFGTRPEAIKLAPLIKQLKKEQLLNVKIVVTAQHRELLDQMLKLFAIKSDYDLNLMKQGQSLAYLTKSALADLNRILQLERPDLVIVHGDTTTALTGGLASFYQQISLAHVEAGLRSGDKSAPFPEEMNRRLLAQLSDFHFVPSSYEQDNLLAEGVSSDKIYICGNTVVESVAEVLDIEVDLKLKFKQVDFSKDLILVTVHRRGNVGPALKEISLALKRLAETEELEIIFLIHPNPAIKEIVYNLLAEVEQIHLMKPVAYPVLIKLLACSYLILTDSGGLQEEAATLKTPLLVLRDKTERKALLATGLLKVVGTKKENIVNTTKELLNDKSKYLTMKKSANPYQQDGTSKQIVTILKEELLEK